MNERIFLVSSFLTHPYDKRRFIKRTFIGDTVATIRTNMSKEPEYREHGLIRATYEMCKGEGALVPYFASVPRLSTVRRPIRLTDAPRTNHDTK